MITVCNLNLYIINPRGKCVSHTEKLQSRGKCEHWDSGVSILMSSLNLLKNRTFKLWLLMLLESTAGGATELHTLYSLIRIYGPIMSNV